MFTDKKVSALTKKVEDNVLGILRQRERELDDQIHDFSHVESKLFKTRDDDALEDLRESRLRQLKALHLRKQEYLVKGYGRLVDVGSDKEFFDACRDVDSIVVHFFRPATPRCRYLDERLARVADSHFDTKFLRVNVEKTPFICERFNIWCIPTLMIVKHGRTDHSIVGFDEFGGLRRSFPGDGFTTENLVAVLGRHGVKECR